jgi:AAA domain
MSNWAFPDLGPYLTGDVIQPPMQGPVRTDGMSLLYAATTNLLFGQSGDGKSLIALRAAGEELTQGRSVLYVDHESSPANIVSRLRVLGVSPELIEAGFIYVRPDGPLDEGTELDIARRIEKQVRVGRALKFVVIDAVCDSVAISGGDENHAGEFARWFAQAVEPFIRRGLTVLLIDHTKRDPETDDLFPRGSSHKRAAIDGVAYRLDVIEPFSRSNSGRARLLIAKDREGVIGPRGATAALIDFSVFDGGDRMQISFEPPGDVEERPGIPDDSEVMEAVSKVFEEKGPSLRLRQIREALPGVKVGVLTNALNALRDRGHISSTTGPRGGERYALGMPFRGSWDTCSSCGSPGARFTRLGLSGVLCRKCFEASGVQENERLGDHADVGF